MKNKILGKLTAGAVSALMTLTALPSDSAAPFAVNASAVYFTSGFDSDADSWIGRGSARIANNTDSYYSGGGSLLVTNRADDWDGAAVVLSADTFIPGESYSFSVAALQMSGSSIDIKMTLQYSKEGEENYDEIAVSQAKSGVWTDISSAVYTIPDGAADTTLYIEIPGSLTDFYIDSFTAAEKNTPSTIVTGNGVVEGIGDQTSQSDPIPGDFNGDKRVDIFDLVLARKALVKNFSGSIMNIDMNAADIDRSGSFEINDVVLLSKFLLGQIKEFPKAETQTTTTTTTTTATATTSVTTSVNGNNSGNYMEKIADDMKISAPASFTQTRAGVDYGTMEKRSYYSKDGGITKNVNILLPPGYNENEKYPVLYVLHGIFGDETSMPGMGIQTMLGNLIADGEAEKMIIVFPAMFTGSGSPGFTAESSRKYDLIREDIENSIMPFMEENYSVKTGRDNTAITGFSMGGREALYTGVTRSEVYGYVGAACPAPGIFPTTDSFMTHEGCMSEGEFKPTVFPYMLLISAAANDGVVGTYPQTYHEALAANGAQHLWQIIPDGDHGGATVTPHMYNFLRYVFKAQ